MLSDLQDQLKKSGVCDRQDIHSGMGCQVGQRVTIAAGGDFETSWNTFTNTSAWLDGFSHMSTLSGYANVFFYNFGDAGGCSITVNPQNCDANGYSWSRMNIMYISDRCPTCNGVTPEIYYSGVKSEAQWWWISKNHYMDYGYRLNIIGVMSSDTACWQNANIPQFACPSGAFTYENSYLAMYNILNIDSVLYPLYPPITETVGEMEYLTDICWLRNQTSNFCLR
jgi:hypothetical protein